MIYSDENKEERCIKYSTQKRYWPGYVQFWNLFGQIPEIKSSAEVEASGSVPLSMSTFKSAVFYLYKFVGFFFNFVPFYNWSIKVKTEVFSGCLFCTLWYKSSNGAHRLHLFTFSTKMESLRVLLLFVGLLLVWLVGFIFGCFAVGFFFTWYLFIMLYLYQLPHSRPKNSSSFHLSSK